MAMALLLHRLASRESMHRGLLYGPDAAAPGYIASKQPWAGGAGTSGSRGDTRTFPTLVDRVRHHSGSMEMAEC